ncbi:MAG: hypothetical protein ABR608_08700 [Pseudonocardiaceae bacterium]
MTPRPRARFWVESTLAAISAVLAVLTAIWPAWIEGLFEVSPDGGSGTMEWWIVAMFAVAALIFAVTARLELRRLAPGS